MTQSGAESSPGQGRQPNVEHPWYAVRVKPRFERVVCQNLAAKDFVSFLPTYKERRRWSDRVRLVELPLFPGYVFCRLDIRQRLPVLQTPGVLHFVSFDGEPAPVDPGEIQSLQTAVCSGAPLAPWPYLREGQRVMVARGPLRGLTGILLKVRDEFRLIISVTLLMRSVAVEIDRESVRPL
ncbi:MAG: transcription termination factor NusG domain protein [Bryobacteraceae bacterium]|nr:MAG: transcription termination factor NusG domain protein [Bryobacteraceae bacterium]